MNWKINILMLLIIFSSCKKSEKVVDAPVSEDPKNSGTPYLIEIDEFQEIMQQSNTKVIDFRKPKIYAKGHIKGALNIWRTDIEDASYPYGGMMASKEQIEKLFSKLGIKNSDTLILYDDNAACDSSRLWWVLQNYNFTNVRMLHGGISIWKTNNGALSTKKTTSIPSVFKLEKKASFKFYATKKDVEQTLKGNKTILLDTRSTDEFLGVVQKKGAFKGGRIPNSQLIDWANAINYSGDKKFKSTEELIKIYNTLEISKSDTIIVYCHSGVRSAHTTFVLTQLLGYTNVKNYDGSWTEWSYFDDLPFEKTNMNTNTNNK